jgi:hypothetical protein
MKKYLLILLSIFICSCTTDDNKPETDIEIFGKWKLIEQYLDPGDGSGTFQSIESNRVIEFFSNGTVTVNGELCYMSSELGTDESGTFTITSDSAIDANYDGFITPNTCSFEGAKINFSITADNTLILWYLCFEGCAQKFQKIN